MDKFITYNTKNHQEFLTMTFDEICNIFGEHYISFNDLRKSFCNEQSYYGYVVFSESRIVAGVLYHLIGNNEAEIADYKRIFSRVGDPIVDKNTIVIDTIFTVDGFRKQGLASKLLTQVINTVNNNIVVISWKNNTSAQSFNIFKQHNFEEILLVPEFWKEDSIKYKYECPVCGNPCTCGAIFLFFKK